jgi:hypothetical protein
MRFLDVKTDFAFKKVFGSQQSKPVLIDFLNAMLDYSGEFAIADLEIVDPYQIPLIKGMKDSFVDVKARLANGSRVIIEMQVLNVEGFEQRIFIPETLNTPSLRQAFDIINEAGMSADELEAQHKRRDFIILQRDALTKAQSDGEQIGLAKGIEIGNGLPLPLIASMFGLTEAELQAQLPDQGL